MRIIHVVSGLQKASGVTTFVEHLVAELRACGHEVEVITKETPGETSARLMAACDLVHIHGMWDPWLHRWARLARRSGVPIVWSTHGMTAPWAMRHKWWKKCLPWRFYQRRDLAGAQVLHCTSEFEAEWNQRLGLEKSFVAPLGADLPRSDERELGDAKQVKGDKTLLFVGRIYPVKALDRLIEAFAIVLSGGKVRNGVEWHLRLVGPDQAGHLAQLMKLCDKVGLPYSAQMHESSGHARVQFVGSRFNGDLDSEYKRCDALALVSHTENFGATLVDAMAHGKPVIAGTKTPWKIVADRGCGWWCDNAPEALSKAIEDLIGLSDDEREQMGARGRKLVEEKYTWKAVCDAMIEGYRRIV